MRSPSLYVRARVGEHMIPVYLTTRALTPEMQPTARSPHGLLGLYLYETRTALVLVHQPLEDIRRTVLHELGHAHAHVLGLKFRGRQEEATMRRVVEPFATSRALPIRWPRLPSAAAAEHRRWRQTPAGREACE